MICCNFSDRNCCLKASLWSYFPRKVTWTGKIFGNCQERNSVWLRTLRFWNTTGSTWNLCNFCTIHQEQSCWQRWRLTTWGKKHRKLRTFDPTQRKATIKNILRDWDNHYIDTKICFGSRVGLQKKVIVHSVSQQPCSVRIEHWKNGDEI